MDKIGWRILDKDECKEVLNELRTQRVSAEKVGFVTLEDGTASPCIRINEGLFVKLVRAGTIGNISVITTFSGAPHLYVKIKINWPSIKEKLVIVLDRWRDRSFLEHLCDVGKLALTTHGRSAIIVDGLNTDDLKLNLFIASMMYHPKDALDHEQ